jgi:hypothetical protein
MPLKKAILHGSNSYSNSQFGNSSANLRANQKEESSRYKRSNVETNMLNVWPGFEVVRIDHTFQMVDLFSLEKNKLVVFPNQDLIF